VDERRRQLLEHIERAFSGVQLGDGVSMHESEAIDNYGTAEERRIAREPDEKEDWRRLVDHPDLTLYFSIAYAGLCFLDAPGLRFHLPACLYRAVRDIDKDDIYDMFESMCYLLLDPDEYNRNRLAILSGGQRACVRACLVYFRDMVESHAEELDRAIIGYWSQSVGA
jgi:hypothetical protein